ncbi:hypothetical protein [Amycolatopsis sp. BJA-103]|uniref:hypothetical protein n=1 Tax=unclassified Amycolatopsis TaxID=2618356 RepID=UPI000C764257|nr:hypothetical protein [Amycolatopsis sp. BJA-103]AUI59100.1 hypothetical protein BKN51_13365 [Amycolatopsis sp. BJA-103]PNE17452.1 hypothetical protein B1H26_21160 [Amycolatopsis sp. BJA-103]
MNTVPGAVRSSRALLFAVAVSHLVIPLVMWANEAALRAEIAARYPGFGQAEVDRSAAVAIESGAVFHGILLVLCVVPAWKLATGRRWTRRLTTATQLLSVVFSVFSWTSSSMFHAVIPVVVLAQVVLVALLWVPRPARDFFA